MKCSEQITLFALLFFCPNIFLNTFSSDTYSCCSSVKREAIFHTDKKLLVKLLFSIPWSLEFWISGWMVIVLTIIQLLHTKVVGINKTCTACEGRFVDTWRTIFEKNFYISSSNIYSWIFPTFSTFKFTFFNTYVCVSVCMEQLCSGRWMILKYYTGGGRGC